MTLSRFSFYIKHIPVRFFQVNASSVVAATEIYIVAGGGIRLNSLHGAGPDRGRAGT